LRLLDCGGQQGKPADTVDRSRDLTESRVRNEDSLRRAPLIPSQILRLWRDACRLRGPGAHNRSVVSTIGAVALALAAVIQHCGIFCGSNWVASLSALRCSWRPSRSPAARPTVHGDGGHDGSVPGTALDRGSGGRGAAWREVINVLV